MTNLDSILKSRDITLPTKVCLKAMVFPVVMYECESWTIKKAERGRIDVFPRRKEPPTPVFLPGESHGQRSLVGYCPWGHKESGMTKHLSTHACMEKPKQTFWPTQFLKKCI